MKVADYIARRLSAWGLDTCFAVTGGGAMHLNDAFGAVGGWDVRYLHHEQACSMAAEGYARLAGKPAVLNITSGPGSINALNGVFGAYTDSVPMVVVAGQARRDTNGRSVAIPGLRQLGDQEARMLEMVAPITVWSGAVDDPASVQILGRRCCSGSSCWSSRACLARGSRRRAGPGCRGAGSCGRADAHIARRAPRRKRRETTLTQRAVHDPVRPSAPVAGRIGCAHVRDRGVAAKVGPSVEHPGLDGMDARHDRVG